MLGSVQVVGLELVFLSWSLILWSGLCMYLYSSCDVGLSRLVVIGASLKPRAEQKVIAWAFIFVSSRDFWARNRIFFLSYNYLSTIKTSSKPKTPYINVQKLDNLPTHSKQKRDNPPPTTWETKSIPVLSHRGAYFS